MKSLAPTSVQERCGSVSSANRHAPLTILLVDDDLDFLSIEKEMLELLGFKVIAAHDGIQALQLVRLENLEFNLVISDFNMPKMDGVETLMTLGAMRPELKKILCSGDTEGECFQGRTVKDCMYLGKPFGLQELDSAVNRVLG